MKSIASRPLPRRVAQRVALVGVMAATITGGKLALAAIPNVEIVTLLCALYGYVFGAAGIAAVFIFVSCESLIWGVGPWLISYFIYWPLVAAIFWLLARFKVINRWLIALCAILLTIFFGVLTSLIDIGLFMGFFDRFWQRFAIYYTRGIVFYATQTVCNAVLFLFLFIPLKNLLKKLYI